MEESEIVQSPKEPSVKSQNDPSIRSQPASIVQELASIKESPLRLPTGSLQRSPIVSSPKAMTPPAPIGSIQSTSSRQGSLKSVRSYKSPSPKSPSPKSQSPKNSSPKSSSPLLQPEQKSLSAKSNNEENIDDTIATFEPQSQNISEHIDELSNTIKTLAKDLKSPQSPKLSTGSNIDKIAEMSQQLTNEANALRKSIKSLSQDIAKTKNEKNINVNFPYHLFLIEIVVNKIHMKCECFEIDYNNLVISASFLGKQPIVLYDPSYGKIENFSKLNVGKSTLFAMTYDKICCIKKFDIIIQLTKQPPCSECVTKIGETRMDYMKEFVTLREDLCKKWSEEKPNDNIQCTTSTQLSKNMYYLSCSDDENHDPIGIIEVSVRMSFLGKEITTAFCSSPKPQTASFLLKQDNGMTMYSCQKVEMDEQGKILLDEDVMTKKGSSRNVPNRHSSRRSESPISQLSSIESSKRSYYDRCPVTYPNNQDGMPKYDEIFTKMNANELKIRVPKSTKVERMGKYDKIQELCSCESTPYNTGEQIQFELPRDGTYPNKYGTHTSNLKYTYTGCDNRKNVDKDRKIINVTPSNCPVPVDMEKMVHPNKDVFILKIGKKLETKDKKTDLEIEFVSPKAPSDQPKPIDNAHISQQCSTGELKDGKPAGKKKKGKGKGKKEKSKKKGKAKKKK
ncbi:uncharacterized protein LOC135088518 [Ostrinia nubilalis]|uniref:uncharacterized protein LOC135088518 n=1 Tax=Ostrinia nubilalis TaxID=29057 RepID=UPI00308229E3